MTVPTMLEEAHDAALHAAGIILADLQLEPGEADQLRAPLPPGVDERLALPIGVAQALRQGLAELGADLGSIIADARHSAVVALLALALDVPQQQLADGVEAAALAVALPTGHGILEQLSQAAREQAEARASEQRRAQLLEGVRS